MKISYSDYYVPDHELLVDDLLAVVSPKALPPGFKSHTDYSWFVKHVLKLHSIRYEKVLDEHQMVSRLLTRLFESRFSRPDLIDVIILAEGSRGDSSRLLKSVQQEYGMERSHSFHVSENECVNFEAALGLASSLLKDDRRLNQILIFSIVKSATTEERMIGSYAVMGDGAGIMLVTRDQGGPRLVDQIIVSASLDPYARTALSLHWKYHTKCLSDLFARNPAEKDNIAHIITQNANMLLVTECLNVTGLSPKKVFTRNHGRYGHLHCLDFVVNMVDLASTTALPDDRLVLATGTAWSGSYAASLLSFQ